MYHNIFKNNESFTETKLLDEKIGRGQRKKQKMKKK